MAKLILAVLVVVVGIAAWWSLRCCHHKHPPTLDPEQWWGPSQLKGKKDDSIKPFKIQFDEQMIQDLKGRLMNHRQFSPPLEGVGMSYGFNSQDLGPWLKYWAEEYPFESRLRFLNQYPQFKTNIQGLDIHFIRVKPQVSAGVQVLPILLMHGWPGSVREFYEAIPLLTTPRPGYNFVFEVVIPSLPGYGFSDAPVRPGLSAPQAGVVMRNLMHRLGYKQYYVQGGDWGAVVASTIATLYPQEVLGHHTNMAFVQNSCTHLRTILGAFLPSLVVEDHLADRMYPLSKFFAYVMEEFGYFHLQATKPDTIGVGLQDSPAGLLAYILEKFHTWTAKRPDALKSYSKDQLIDNLMVYWSTGSITTSMRLYAESFSNEARAIDWNNIKSEVPTWALQAKYELFYQPPALLKTKYPNLLNTTVLDDGGHFIALQMPKVYAEDVFRAVKAFREWRQKNEKTEL